MKRFLAALLLAGLLTVGLGVGSPPANAESSTDEGAALAYLGHLIHEADRNNPHAVELLIRLRWMGTGQESRAVRIAWCESRFKNNTVSPSGGHLGIFQLSTRYHAWRFGAMGFPVAFQSAWPNINAAYHLWQEQGWGPWACR